MSIDWRWMSQGGILLDGSGDLAVCADEMESYIDITRSRLKAAIDGWKLYRDIAANLKQALGNALVPEQEIALRQRVVSCLTKDFLPLGSFDVQTLAIGDQISVFVYIGEDKIAQATVSLTADSVEVS